MRPHLLSLALAALSLSTTGCYDPRNPWPSVQFYDDGTTLWIAADSDGDFTSDIVAVTADGIRHELEVRDQWVTPNPGGIALGGYGPLKTEIPSPLDRRVEIEIVVDGVSAFGDVVTLPSGILEVDLSATHVSRSTEFVIVSYVPLPDEDTMATTTTVCGNWGTYGYFQAETPGTIAIDLDVQPPPEQSACTHEIQVNQRLTLATADIYVRLDRIAVREVTSDP